MNEVQVPGPRPCPVCLDAGPRRAVYRQRFEASVLSEGYSVVICGACGTVFADGVPGQLELEAHYASHSKYAYPSTGGMESTYDFERFRIVADEIARFLPAPDTRILDVGCATGGLLSVLKNRGYRRLLGADPSPECASLAQSLHGLEVRSATIAQLEGWPEKFDGIMLVGVLEHLADPRASISILAGMLNPGGYVYAAVPDLEEFSRCRNAPYQQLSMEHVNFFTAGSMDRLFGEMGFGAVGRWKTILEWSEGVMEPVASALYSRSTCPHPFFDATGGPAIERYIESSAAADRGIVEFVDSLAVSGMPLFVWGAGSLTRRLLACSRLGEANIRAFVDSNSHLQGKLLSGREVWSPDQLEGHDEAILICSIAFEREISKIVRVKLGLKNRLLRIPL